MTEFISRFAFRISRFTHCVIWVLTASFFTQADTIWAITDETQVESQWDRDKMLSGEVEITHRDYDMEERPLQPEYERAKRIYTHLAWATYLRTTATYLRAPNRLSDTKRAYESDAKKAYESVLREHETSAFVRTQLASLNILMQDIKAAERQCRRAIEIDPQNPTAHFLLGQILLSRSRNATGKWDDAIAEFQKVTELDSTYSTVWLYGEIVECLLRSYHYLGEIAEARNNFESAIRAFKELTRIRPSQPLYYLRLGYAYNQLGKKQEAIAAYERVVRINRNMWQAYQALVNLYVEKIDQSFSQLRLTSDMVEETDMVEEAKANIEKAILAYTELRRIAPSTGHQEHDTSLMELRSRLGSVYVHLHQEQKAIEILQQVLAEDSNNVDANYWMGIAYQALGDFEKADHYVRKATTLAPKRVVRLYFTQQKYEEAIEMLQKALEEDSDNVDANYWIGLAYQELGNFEKAEHYLRKTIMLAPEHEDGHNALVYLYFAFHQEQRSIEILQKILEADSNNVDANYWSGLAFQKLGNFEKAEYFLRKTIALAPDREEGYNTLGYLFAEYGTHLDEAVELIKKALEKSPGNGAYLDSLGWVYFKQGKLDAALTELEKAVRYMPNSAEIQDHLGEVYLESGLKAKAIAAWKKAIQLEPDNTELQQKLTKYQGNGNVKNEE